jgi:hypothetical protein
VGLTLTHVRHVSGRTTRRHGLVSKEKRELGQQPCELSVAVRREIAAPPVRAVVAVKLELKSGRQITAEFTQVVVVVKCHLIFYQEALSEKYFRIQ